MQHCTGPYAGQCMCYEQCAYTTNHVTNSLLPATCTN